MLANEHEQIAIAIGRAKVGYEPKLAIAHEVAWSLFGGPTTGPNQNPNYALFRRVVHRSHREAKLV